MLPPPPPTTLFEVGGGGGGFLILTHRIPPPRIVSYGLAKNQTTVGAMLASLKRGGIISAALLLNLPSLTIILRIVIWTTR